MYFISWIKRLHHRLILQKFELIYASFLLKCTMTFPRHIKEQTAILVLFGLNTIELQVTLNVCLHPCLLLGVERKSEIDCLIDIKEWPSQIRAKIMSFDSEMVLSNKPNWVIFPWAVFTIMHCVCGQKGTRAPTNHLKVRRRNYSKRAGIS